LYWAGVNVLVERFEGYGRGLVLELSTEQESCPLRSREESLEVPEGEIGKYPGGPVPMGNRSRLKEQGLLAVLELGDWTGLKRSGK